MTKYESTRRKSGHTRRKSYQNLEIVFWERPLVCVCWFRKSPANICLLSQAFLLLNYNILGISDQTLVPHKRYWSHSHGFEV